MTTALDFALIVLESYVLLFLLVHDWVPLGRLNNNAAKFRLDSRLELGWTTLLPAVPSAIGLWGTTIHIGARYPGWLLWLLWITYGSFLLGMLRAWWIPYLLAAEPERAARYDVIFAGTHRFLPKRHGIAPDTLHVSLHVAVVAIVVLLVLR